MVRWWGGGGVPLPRFNLIRSLTVVVGFDVTKHPFDNIHEQERRLVVCVCGGCNAKRRQGERCFSKWIFLNLNLIPFSKFNICTSKALATFMMALVLLLVHVNLSGYGTAIIPICFERVATGRVAHVCLL